MKKEPKIPVSIPEQPTDSDSNLKKETNDPLLAMELKMQEILKDLDRYGDIKRLPADPDFVYQPHIKTRSMGNGVKFTTFGNDVID